VSASQLITPEDQATSDMQDMYNKGTTAIHEALAGQSREVDASSIQSILAEQDQNLQEECRAYYAKRLEQLRAESAAAPSQTEVPSRKSVLMHMFKMTGQVKIPLIVEMLKKWIDDPAKGKLCLFAHHISVLNEIEKLTGLSNAAKSKSQYIRIDGSTGAKLRQEQINSFQKNPKVRVALLGITAAGVAVTLTASSTVWFAELFWTPALMIQAEDR
jgi:SWI/SNF-related matrix-associated actin-dependent regulator 1 of chromatin subfamily A